MMFKTPPIPRGYRWRLDAGETLPRRCSPQYDHLRTPKLLLEKEVERAVLGKFILRDRVKSTKWITVDFINLWYWDKDEEWEEYETHYTHTGEFFTPVEWYVPKLTDEIIDRCANKMYMRNFNTVHENNLRIAEALGYARHNR